MNENKNNTAVILSNNESIAVNSSAPFAAVQYWVGMKRAMTCGTKKSNKLTTSRSSETAVSNEGEKYQYIL